MTGHWSSMQVYISSISDTTGWQSTYSSSIVNIQITPTSGLQKPYIYVRMLSSDYFFIHVQSNQQQFSGLNYKFQVLLEPSTKRHFFPNTLRKQTQSCTVCAKEKSHLSFVSTNTVIWGFHSWVSSRYSQKPRETQEMNVGPSVSP